MSSLIRFGVSLDQALLDKFDQLIQKKGYANRSEAIRDLIRDSLIRDEWEDPRDKVVGTLTVIVDQKLNSITKKLAQTKGPLQEIISTMHVQLDDDNSLEVSAVRGCAKVLRKLANELIGTKGVKHGSLVMTTTGKNLK
ncbi:nickel-responsive transcriptional regulator NikR [candidate division KSB1 bacterium]|nr:nickel-responsive transcriptional regulator NikR [candidate division KSB1 bacterium]RQW01251.1 MAG: nickel-responsive transcriptional regulator NikR [candidate division KSB1 bacterium]